MAARACITVYVEREREGVVARARANSASSHGFDQNENHAVFFGFKFKNERNAFSLMGMELSLTKFKNCLSRACLG